MANRKQTKLLDRTYFVSKLHEAAKGMLLLLTERLDGTGWRNTCNTLSQVQVYSKGNRTRVLIRTTHSELADTVTHTYYEGENELSLGEYLAQQIQVTKLSMALMQVLTVQESVYRLIGTAEMIAVYSSETGIFVRAIGSADTHAMLAEYYTLAKDPETLYSATIEGLLYELVEDEDEGGFADVSDS